MMKWNSIILLLSCSLTIMACKKYNEGPMISFRSKRERVANTWKLDERYMADTLNMWDDTLNTGLLTFTTAGEYTLQTDTLIESGKWVFNHNKKKIVLDITNDSHVRPDLLLIQKLKEEELWWSYVDTSGTTIEERYVPN